MNRKTTKKVDESTLTTLCAVCRGAFLDAKGVRLRRADPRQLVKDVCTYCQTRYGFDYYVQPIVRKCKFAYQMVNSALLIPCAEYQRVLHVEKVAHIAENFSEYIANDPKVSFRDGRYYVFDGQNTVEARRACNGGKDLPIRCKVFLGLSKEDEATLFALQTGISTCLTAGERLRANLVARNPDAIHFVRATVDTGVEFAYDGIRAAWKIYCIETAYELYKQYGRERYIEMLNIINEAWRGNVDAYLAGVIRGVTRFISVYEGEYDRERLVQQLARTHPKTITQLAQKDTGSSANRHMRQILRLYNGASREMSLPLKN